MSGRGSRPGESRIPGVAGGKPRATATAALCVVMFAVNLGYGQELGTERFFYAIESLSTGEVLRRGRSAESGLPDGSLILGPNRGFRMWLYEIATGKVGHVEFTTPANGQRFTIPKVELGLAKTPDFDDDGLSDDAEFVIGTSPRERDTDGDGKLDGVEVFQGSDPSDGRPTLTGILGTVDTPGTAFDVCAFDDLAVVADGEAGVSVFNIFNTMNPVLLARIPTRGSARRVACAPDLIAAATGASGLAVIDFSVPALATLLHEVPLFSGSVRAIAVADGLGYVGTEAGSLLGVDLRSGTAIARAQVGQPIHDLAVAGDTLLVLAANRVFAFATMPGFPALRGSVGLAGRNADGVSGTRRLFAGGGVGFATSASGFEAIDIDDPTAMAIVGPLTNTGFQAFKQIVHDGSGAGVAAAGSNFPRADDVSIFDLSDIARTNALLETFPTPGIAYAISIYNGLAYVAGGASGLQVLNYRSADAAGVPPAIALAADFLAAAEAEEGRNLVVMAGVDDDVQARNVEFYVDGIKALTDGNFPFEFRFRAPRLRDQRTFRLRARASDTGGNAEWTDEVVVTLLEDTTPPFVVGVLPPDGSFRGAATAITAFFSEAIEAATLAGRFALIGPGLDLVVGTPDDAPVAVEAIDIAGGNERATLRVGALGPGRYRGTVAAGVTDLAGNPTVGDTVWEFTIYAVAGDADADCVPDALEVALGFDPANADSDQNGVLDGEEDSDADGLLNCAEVLVGTRLDDADSDGDTLADADEIARGTNPLDGDTDGDGFLDGEEVEFLSDPLRDDSTPAIAGVATLVFAPSVSVLNTTSPATSVSTLVFAPTVSVLNTVAPPAGIVVAPMVSVRNLAGE